MFFRETGKLKHYYRQEQAMLPLREDRFFVAVVALAAFVVVPIFANEYWLQAILIPMLVFAVAAIGLNILTGYCGQRSF